MLIPERLLEHWEGTGAPSGGRVVEATFRWSSADAPATDYDRACDVDTWLDSIAVGDGRALVLGGDDTSAAHIADSNGTLVVIRCIYGEDEANVLRLLKAGWPVVREERAVEFEHPGGDLLMMAAADWSPEFAYEPVRIDLVAGRYVVATQELRDESSDIIVHRFNRVAYSHPSRC